MLLFSGENKLTVVADILNRDCAPHLQALDTKNSVPGIYKILVTWNEPWKNRIISFLRFENYREVEIYILYVI